MKILKVKGTEVFSSELINFFTIHNIWQGNKFCISWKIGKKRKIRRYKILDIFVDKNERVGDYIMITLNKNIKLDNSLGPLCLTFS